VHGANRQQALGHRRTGWLRKVKDGGHHTSQYGNAAEHQKAEPGAGRLLGLLTFNVSKLGHAARQHQ
jgi:hypothetical protein